MTTYIVDSIEDIDPDGGGASDGKLTLREAIIAANTNTAFGDASAGSAKDRDEIRFSDTIDTQTILLAFGELSITDTLWIDGNGTNETRISGSGSRIFNIDLAADEHVQIDDVTLMNGTTSGDGGAIYAAGVGEASDRSDLYLHGVQFLNNSAGRGGGLFAMGINVLDGEGTSFFNRENTFIGNTATEGAAAFAVGGTVPAGAYTPRFNFSFSDPGGQSVELTGYDGRVWAGDAAATIDAGDGSTWLYSGPGADTFLFGDDLVEDVLRILQNSAGAYDTFPNEFNGLNGDTVREFSPHDRVQISGHFLDLNGGSHTITPGATSTTVSISSNYTSSTATFTLEGDFTQGALTVLGVPFTDNAFDGNNGLAFGFVPFLPTLTDRVAADTTGTLPTQFILDYGRAFEQFSFDLDPAAAGALFDNAVGVVLYDETSDSYSVEILATNAKDGGSLTTADGLQLVDVFLIQNSLEIFNTYGTDTGFSFDETANALLWEESAPFIWDVFFAFHDDWNADGAAHALVGANPDGGLIIGFEDETNLGDADYQDVIVNFEAVLGSQFFA